MTNDLISRSALVHILSQAEGGVNMKKTDVTRDAQVAITQKNELLTIEQLRKMSGMPAWWDDGSEGCWGIIAVDAGGRWKDVPFFMGRRKQLDINYDIEKRGMKIYRFPPNTKNDKHAIWTAPAVDAEPVRHGEWILNPCNIYNDATWVCSVCGKEWVLLDGTPHDNQMDYCSHCGARMDRGTDND